VRLLIISILFLLPLAALASDAGPQLSDGGALITSSDAGPAAEQTAPDVIESGSGLWRAIKDGRTLAAVGFGLFLLLALARLIGGKVWPDFWKGKAGGYVLALMGWIGTFAALLISGVGLGEALALSLGVTTSAMGIQGPASAIGQRAGLIKKPAS